MYWLDALWHDLRFAARVLVRSPGFALAAVLCLTIGIGVTTAIYSNLQSLVFRLLPTVRAPEELVRFQSRMPFGNWVEVHDRSDQFRSLAAFMGPVPFVLSGGDRSPDRIWGHLATPNYFNVLGVRPMAGRLFGSEEARDGAGQVAVISHRLWQGRYGGLSTLIGQAIRVNGQLVTVIGVAPRDFLGASPMLAAADLWIPTTAPARVAPELAGLRQNRTPTFDLLGRLKTGTTLAQAEAALEPLVRQLEQLHADPGRDRKERRVTLLPGGRLYPVRDEDMPKAVGLPLVLVALVLVMACGNVANMLVARGASRRREIAVRLSIGAGRGRVVRQLLTESLLLAVLGGAGGLLFARWEMHWYQSMGAMFPGYLSLEMRMDWRALVIGAMVTVASCFFFGLAPALAATRDDIASGLKPAAGLRLHARRWFSLRNILVAQQVMASIVLLMLTGFIVVGFGSAASADLGFNYRHLYLLNVDPVRDGYSQRAAAEYVDKVVRRLAELPGISAVAVAGSLPVAFTGVETIATAKVEMMGGPRSLGTIHTDRVGPGFFDAVGLPLIRGRGFATRNASDDARVMVVNETMARQVWPGEDPLGRTVEFDDLLYQVIGVVGDVRSALPLSPPQPGAYLPVTPTFLGTPSREGVTVIARARPGYDAGTYLRDEMRAFDPNVTVFNVRRMEDLVGQVFYLVRVVTSVYGTLGVFALVLACVGLASVTAYSVASRTHEIGIRVALGATRGDVLKLVLRESVGIILVAGAAGLALALAVMRVLSGILNAMAEATRMSASDPRLVFGAPALLMALALLACYIPARKSVQLDPAAALKAE
jgi:predicted permease